MGKMNELDLCIGELRNAAQSLTAVADNLTALFRGGTPQHIPTDSFTQNGNGCVQLASAGTVTIDDGKATVTKAAAPKPLTLEQVRAVLAEKSRDGHTAKVRALLEKHGANKLSEINPGKYPMLLQEAEEIGSE